MSTKFKTAIAKGEDSFKVGQEVAKVATDKIGDCKIDLTVIFCSSKYNYQEVINGVRDIIGDVPLIGCSSAGEFTEEKVENNSVACAVISSDTHKFFTGLGTGLKEDEIKCMEEASANFPTNVKDYPYKSAILLIDGLAGKGEESVLAALSVLGPEKFSGGAAGDDLKFDRTCIFVNDKVSDNAVSLTQFFSKVPVSIAVKHGHSPISPPLTITKSEGNIVYEIDNRSPIEVWKEYTREDAKKLGIDVDTLSTPEEVSQLFTRYEAGLLTITESGVQYKIRWLGGTTTTDGPITFPCAVPEGVVIRVMKSPKEDQIASAKEAAEMALEGSERRRFAGAIIFDCVCRAVICGDDFHKAVGAIKEALGEIPFIGVETYGEIAMEMGQLSGFHNTTTVILLIPK